MDDRSTLRVLVFPADDIALRHEVDHALAQVDPGLDETSQIAELENRLKPWYRSLTIRTRDALGGYDDDPTRVWYVYRDGRIRARRETLERLYASLADARWTIRASASAMERARRSSKLAGYSPETAPATDTFEAPATAGRSESRPAS